MKRIKKPISILLTVLMIFGVFAAVPFSASAEGNSVAKVGNTEYASFSDALNAWTEGTTLTLLSDIEMTQTPGISVRDAKTLDLNGKTLSLASSVSSKQERVIEVVGDGDLTIKDSSGKNAGKITGASPSGDEGWSAGLYINQNCTATMYGGTITGNKTKYGAGVWIDGRHTYSTNRDATFNMYGGVITGNTAEWGGGVYVGCKLNSNAGTGHFNMYGGTITGNTATSSDSSNVYNAYYGVTTHTGGTIDGGYVDGQNLYVTVSFNANGGNGTMSDQYVKKNTDTQIKANENYDNNGAKTEPAFTRKGYTFAGWNTKEDGSGTDYTAGESSINISANTTLYAKWTPNKYTVTWKNWDGTVLKTDNDVVAGTTPTYNGETPTKADDDNAYTFTGWNPAVVAVTADATYTATFDVAPYVASVTSNGTTTKYTDFGTAVSNWTDGSTLTLLADVQTDSTIIVTGTQTLDLNGYGITKSGQGRAFKVDGNLTINDSNPTRSTHNYSVDSTGLASLDNNGTQSFQGGYITGGHGFSQEGENGWGGFALVDKERKGNRSLTINGGTIIGNQTELGGGGAVRLNSNSTFIMNGGAIIYNTTAHLTESQVNDGAVSGEPDVTFYIGGGTIAHNTTKGSVTSDLYLASGQKIIVNKELNSDTSIGIKMQSNTGVFTNSADPSFNDPTKFFSDNSGYGVFKNADGQLELKDACTVTWKNGDTVLKTEKVAKGTIPQYTGETPAKADDAAKTYTFSGWTPAITAVTADTTYTATFTAKYKKLFTGHSITLDGDIGVNFFINSAYADFANAKTATVTFTWDGGNYNAAVNLKDLTHDKDGLYKATCSVVAAHMAHKIHAEVYLDGKKLDETDDYSVKEYAEELYFHPEAHDDKGKPDALRELAKALLNYGAQAQTVFDSQLKEKPELANKTVGKNGYGAVKEEDMQQAINIANPGKTATDLSAVGAEFDAKFYTHSLMYLSKNTLRLYFVPEKGLTMLHPELFKGSLDNYYYYVEEENIAAADLDKMYEFKIDKTTVNFSALDYAKAVAFHSSMPDVQKDLAKSLYLYNAAANAYFD